MTLVKQGDKVKIHYVGKTEREVIFSSSVGKKPLSFTVGHYSKLEGLNVAVLGMQVGEKKSVKIPALNAFGEYNDSLLVSYKLDNLPQGINVGDVVLDNRKKKWLVRNINEDKKLASLDGNHILAGEDLIFDIEVLEILQ